ncbi:hypothetical protein, partial [Kingella kingae]
PRWRLRFLARHWFGVGVFWWQLALSRCVRVF